jgi:hypothetical protein
VQSINKRLHFRVEITNAFKSLVAALRVTRTNPRRSVNSDISCRMVAISIFRSHVLFKVAAVLSISLERDIDRSDGTLRDRGSRHAFLSKRRQSHNGDFIDSIHAQIFTPSDMK